MAEETTNQLALSKEVKAYMDDIRLLLPVGYEIHTSYDATEFIQEELGKIYLRTGGDGSDSASVCAIDYL